MHNSSKLSKIDFCPNQIDLLMLRHTPIYIYIYIYIGQETTVPVHTVKRKEEIENKELSKK